MSAEPKPRVVRDDHALYTWSAVLALVVVFAGFSRTFFLKRVFGTPELPWLPIVHGIVMTLWFSLFLVQARLVALGRAADHRRLGVLGSVLAVAVVIAGVGLGVSAARLGHTPGPPPLIFLGVPLFDMLVFTILIIAAIQYRKQVATHRRLMLVASLSMLTAAISRIPIAFIHEGGLLMYFGLTDLIIVLCVVYDSARHRRLHPAFGWGAALVLASLPLRMWIMGTPTWMRFATWVVS